MKEYDVVLVVQVNKTLTADEKYRLERAILKAMDETNTCLPYNADVVTGSVLER